jgi:hypothetical protein
MRFLDDERLYSHTEDCLRFLEDLGAESAEARLQTPERYHMYWHGTFSLKQAFAVKSFLATQNLARSELWLWLDAGSGYDGYEENRFLRPLLSFVQVRRFDSAVEAKETPVENRPDLYADLSPTRRSNFFRFVVLYRYGGTYADMDMMFLRDLSGVRRVAQSCEEFCYRWSAHLPYANSAVLRLRRHGDTARALLNRCCERGSFRPRDVLRFEDDADLDLFVLPCVLFDPLWPHHDQADRYRGAPFNQFEDFFRTFGWVMRRRLRIGSYRDFFPGAFAYHWHNCWNAPEEANSYFDLFNREIDGILRDRLAVEIADP